MQRSKGQNSTLGGEGVVREHPHPGLRGPHLRPHLQSGHPPEPPPPLPPTLSCLFSSSHASTNLCRQVGGGGGGAITFKITALSSISQKSLSYGGSCLAELHQSPSCCFPPQRYITLCRSQPSRNELDRTLKSSSAPRDIFKTQSVQIARI